MSLYDDFLSRDKTTSVDIKDYYEKYAQEWINKYFYDTTLIRTIKEEKYPFEQEYIDYEVHVDSVSEVTLNTTKVMANYLSLIFKDCDHKTYRGQKYLYEDEPYLCYDTTNDLARIAKSQIIKCNNTLRWINSSGKLIQEPCFIGWELTATNSNITKDATVEQRRLICLVQGNEDTNDIIVNQRFLLSPKSAFKVNQIFKENLDNVADEYSTMITIYIEWSSVLNTDNINLLLADYYTSNYTLQINQSNLSLAPSSTGTLTATTTLNDNVVTVPLTWTSSNPLVATIDSSGHYELIGDSGDTCTITCTIEGNTQVSDSITISIADTPSTTKALIVTPESIDTIKQNTIKSIYFGVYINGVLQADVVTLTKSWTNSAYYTITNISGGIDIKCIKPSSTPLVLTFTSGALTKTMTINLVGLL